MRQHQDPDDVHHEDLDRYDEEDEEDLEELGTPVYQGTGLSVRALTAEELQRFLDAHAGQPGELLGSGWAALDPPGHSAGVPRTPPAAPLPVVPAESPAGSLGSPGRSALAQYRRQRALELAGLPQAGLVGLALGALVGWRLRFRPSEQARSWHRGADGERRTARLLRRLQREGFVVFHDLAVPDSQTNVDHLVIGPTGVFVIDSKQWTGQVRQGGDGLVWHNHYRLDRTLETVRWEAQQVSRLLGSGATALLCVHGAHVHGGGVHAHGVAIVAAGRLRDALGYDRVLSDVEVELLAAAARLRLRPAA